MRFIVERYEQTWAEDMASLLLDIKAEVEAAQPGQMTILPERLTHCEKRYDDLIELYSVADPPSANPPVKNRGRKNKKQSIAKQLLNRLGGHQGEVGPSGMTSPFPLDNHSAGHDVKMVKVKQKNSEAFRPGTGAETFCAIPSYGSTVR